MKKSLVMLLIIMGISHHDLWAWSGFFREKGVRDSVASLARAFEDQDIDSLRQRISNEFLQGNPEIIGRVQDSFDKFERTKLTYKIASIQVVDGIASVRLNWVKTNTDRMNNWTYRDIGNDVVMHFSAVEPYQLVGLQEPNLFGVSFLLQARIITFTPALAKMEIDRKKLELEERKLALEELRDEQERIRAREEALERARAEREAQTRARAQEEIRRHRQRGETPPLPLPVRSTPKTQPQPTSREITPAQPAISSKPPATPIRRSPSTPDPYSRPASPPVALPSPLYTPAPPTAETEPPVSDFELTQEIREKAEAEALLLLSRRRPAPDIPSPPATPPAAPTSLDIPPEVEAWRQEALREIRPAPATTPAPPATTAPFDEPILSPSNMEDARRRAAERARQLTEKDETGDQSTQLADLQQHALERATQMPAPTSPLTKTPDSNNLLEMEKAARLEAEIREKADAEALQLMALRTRDVPPPATEIIPDDSAAPPTTVEDDLKLQEEIRAKAEEEARRMLATKTPPPETEEPDTQPSVLDMLLQTETREPTPPSTQKPDDFDILEIVEVAVTEPERIMEETTPAPPAAPSPTPDETEPPIPPVLKPVKGGEQPSGPSYDFHMAKFEVTNQEFCRFLIAARHNTGTAVGRNMHFDGDGNVFMDETRESQNKIFSITNMDFAQSQTGIRYADNYYTPVPGRENHPVTGVSWYGALKFCNWLTLAFGLGEKNLCYNEGPEPLDWRPATLSEQQWVKGFSNSQREEWLRERGGFRLPMNNYNSTAGEYNEFYLAAAWAGEQNTVYGFGRDTISGADANFLGSGYPPQDGIAPVGFYNGSDHNGIFQTNPNDNMHGIYDLSGNVWEWSNDTTGNIMYRALYGGSWRSDQDSIKAAYRGSISPHNTADHVGFRVVINQLPPDWPGHEE